MTKQLYIIHGYGASPEKHWFPWLKKVMEEKNWKVSVLEMPDSEHPKFDKWLETMRENIKNINEDTYFVAHSLGTITILQYLSEYKNLPRFGGFILVSGFDEGIAGFEELHPFVKEKPDYKKINEKAELRAVVAAKDDHIVPVKLSEKVAEKLNGKFYPVEKGGHFLDREGFTELPLVKEILEENKN
ncbi:RBBP9/YdeN family alpha/beta hydrolase [Pseudoleptotrichia goodfellowii]|uniref:Uncharacterized protein n=1 Tax=Pseudoleptotrichia goodfellowii TaxID=157692 RepID=A0A510JAW1_9FUSO|nr:alpha/beta hydrolase [Pseudoleptotrichia goodfellowii]BBM35541.1 hypothetical protein JCM16774_0466 [Pseudoleptotrichia goodfellowii]